jgi:hypothetical protein
MGIRPDGMTLDRIDVNADYTPENCRWSSARTQGNNRRDNLRFTYLGEEKTIAEWSRIHGLSHRAVYNRLMLYGWDIEKALTTPVRPTRKRG